MLLADALDDYLFEGRKLSPTTRRWYTQKLATFQQWCHDHDLTTMEQVTARGVRRFLDSLDDVNDPRKGTRITTQTQHGYTQVVKQWLRWCGREGYCARDLYDRVKLPKVEHRVFQTLSQEHIAALFDACAQCQRRFICDPDRR